MIMSDRKQGLWPLSTTQQGIWFGQLLYSGSPLYNTAECLEIKGSLDPVLFERALGQMVGEAETLNLRFTPSGTQPMQFLDPDLPWQLQHLDFSMAVDPQQAARDWMQRDLKCAIDPKADKLFSQALIRLTPDCHYWYQRIHHIAIDGYGTSLLMRRLAEIYTAFHQGKSAPPNPFGPLQTWLAEDSAYQTSEQRQGDRTYWLASLEGAPEPASFSDRLAPIAASSLRQEGELSSEAFLALQSVARQLKASWPDFLLAVTAVYLHRVTGERDVLLGVPMMGRLGSAAIRIPAMVMNIVPLRVSVSPEVQFVEIVKQIGARLREISSHHRYRYEQLRRDLQRARGDRRLFGPVVNIMPFDQTFYFSDAIGRVRNISPGPVEDIAFNIRTQAGGQALKIALDGNPAAYSRDDLAQHEQNWLAVLQTAVEDPNFTVGTASEAEEEQIPRTIIRGEPLASPSPSVLERFVAQARRQPQATAVVMGTTNLSYDELLHQARDLAARLMAAGVKPGQLVAICLPPSPEAIAAIFGVLFSGAAYLALDPEASLARNASLLQDARPVLSIVSTDCEALSQPGLPPLFRLDALPPLPQETVAFDPPPEDSLAYVIYTSGSTGNPKGVMVERGALAHFVAAALQEYGIQSSDRLLQFAALHFDASVEEIFLALCSGATLVVREKSMLESLPGFLRACEEQQISVLDLPTAFWHELAFCVRNGRGRLPDRLRLVIIGGEAAQPERVRQWHEASGDRVRLLNTYGPSETTVVVTSATLEPNLDDRATMPIGRPLPGVDVAVLDREKRPVSEGQAGELYVLGPTLARGYWGRSQLTSDRFVCLSQFPGQPRAYATGDRVCLDEAGRLVFLGRLDDSFKISGHRVDPAEIEALLAEIPNIREVAVVGRTLSAGNKHLCVYLVAEPPYPSVRSLRQRLSQKLPAAVIPTGFNFTDVLPKTSSGKVDRKVLRDRPSTEFAEPIAASPLETIILRIWETILGQRGISVQDDFFALGGQSLQMIQVANLLGAQLGREIPIATLFRHPTAAQLACALSQQGEFAPEQLEASIASPPQSGPFAPLLPISDGPDLPLFCIHPIAGLSWCYLGLARYLDTPHPIYGLQSPYLETGIPAFSSPREGWEEIVTGYIELVRQIQPRGAYRLLGWSLGGTIAQAMAAQLQAEGDEVERLILLDAYPSRAFKRRDAPDEAEVMAFLLQATGLGNVDPSLALQSPDEAIAQFRQGAWGSQFDRSRLQALQAIVRYHIELARQAPTPQLYRGDLLFFTAKQGQREANLTHQIWQPFVNGSIHNYDLDAEHGRILTGDCLQTVARTLSSHLT